MINPTDVLKPVDLKKYNTREETSPAYDLAWIRYWEKHNELTQRRLDLTNEKWRLKYRKIWRTEQGRIV